MKERQDIDRVAETVEGLQQQYADLEAEFKSETEALAAKIDPLTENLEVVTIRPKKTDIAVQLVSLVWEPNWQNAQREMAAAWV